MRRILPYIFALVLCSRPLQAGAIPQEEVIFNPDPPITLEIQDNSSSHFYLYGTVISIVGYAIASLTMPTVKTFNRFVLRSVFRI